MTRFAPPAGLQGNLPLVDMPSLEIPQQQELANSLDGSAGASAAEDLSGKRGSGQGGGS